MIRADIVHAVCANTGLQPLDVLPCLRRASAVLRRFRRNLRDYTGDVSSIIGVLQLQHDPTRPGATKLVWWLESLVPSLLARQLAADFGIRRSRQSTALSQLSTEELPYDPFIGQDACPSEAELRTALRVALQGLPTRDQMLLRLRVEDGLTWREIGERLGVSNQRVGQLEKKALRRLAETFSRATGEYTSPDPGFNLRKK